MDIYGYSLKAVVVCLVFLFIVVFTIGIASLLEPNFVEYTDSQGHVVHLPSPDKTNPTLVRVALAANTVLSAISLTFFGAASAFELKDYMRIYPQTATIDLYSAVVTYEVLGVVLFYGLVLLTATLFYLGDGGWSANPGTILAPLPTMFDTALTLVCVVIGAKTGTKLAIHVSRLLKS
ncbi:hypothetical protein C4564_03745 [Candidatus Microgenomates bacterium]|nr:MAG: hypothetical protein C4564_03745 [Candidatus Microgenomates bacterium]